MRRQENPKYVNVEQRRRALESCVKDHIDHAREQGKELSYESAKREMIRIAERHDRKRGWG